ncbi:hypothetical protein OH687_18595 [Burkholderia anthina]|nr:hypothetical protein OH687_18595 [Burkholderia anthina]
MDHRQAQAGAAAGARTCIRQRRRLLFLASARVIVGSPAARRR